MVKADCGGAGTGVSVPAPSPTTPPGTVRRSARPAAADGPAIGTAEVELERAPRTWAGRDGSAASLPWRGPGGRSFRLWSPCHTSRIRRRSRRHAGSGTGSGQRSLQAGRSLRCGRCFGGQDVREPTGPPIPTPGQVIEVWEGPGAAVFPAQGSCLLSKGSPGPRIPPRPPPPGRPPRKGITGRSGPSAPFAPRGHLPAAATEPRSGRRSASFQPVPCRRRHRPPAASRRSRSRAMVPSGKGMTACDGRARGWGSASEASRRRAFGPPAARLRPFAPYAPVSERATSAGTNAQPCSLSCSRRRWVIRRSFRRGRPHRRVASKPPVSPPSGGSFHEETSSRPAALRSATAARHRMPAPRAIRRGKARRKRRGFEAAAPTAGRLRSTEAPADPTGTSGPCPAAIRSSGRGADLRGSGIFALRRRIRCPDVRGAGDKECGRRRVAGRRSRSWCLPGAYGTMARASDGGVADHHRMGRR